MPCSVSYNRLKCLMTHRRSLLKWKQTYFPYNYNLKSDQSFCSLTLVRLIPHQQTQSPNSNSSSGGFHRGFCLNKYWNLQLSYSLYGNSFSTGYNTFEEQPPTWLFVSDGTAGAYGAQVNLDLDLQTRFSSQEWLNAMRNNIEYRQIQFDLDSLVSYFDKLSTLTQERCRLEVLKEDFISEKRSWKTAAQVPHMHRRKEVEKYLDECKHMLKDLNSDFWSVEEKVITMALRLPNDIHPSTPLEKPIIKEERMSKIVSSHSLNHVEIGKKFNLIKFSHVGPQAYYLIGDLALASRKLCDMACNFFLDQDYRLMLGPTFFKTPILESCGRDVYNKEEVLTKRHSSRYIEPMTHLTGVSLMTFAAYMAKLCVGDSYLPLKMFSIGPHYQSGNSLGLYGAGQTTQIGTFCATAEKDVEACYEEMVDLIWNFISSFGFSIRLTQCSAPALRKEEKRRTEVEIWAPGLKKFIPVASVSDHGDYISRRQMSVHNHNHADIRHTNLLHMVSGTAVNLTTLLAVWMESSPVDSLDGFSPRDLPVLSVNDR